MFERQIKKIMYTPVNPSFTIQKLHELERSYGNQTLARYAANFKKKLFNNLDGETER